MEGEFKIEKPDEMRATLKMTMSIAEWKSVQEQLGSKWPAGTLNRMITAVVAKAQATFQATIKAEDV